MLIWGKLQSTTQQRLLPIPHPHPPEPAPPPPPRRILSTSSLPSTAATAVLRLGALTAFAPPPDVLVPPPPLGLKMVLRLLVDGAGSACLGAAGGGGTENRARS